MHFHLTSLAVVAAGGAIGAGFRHLLGMALLRLFGSGFPYGTFAANILGALLMGAFIAMLQRWELHGQHLRLFLTTGLLGGFTTFSAFSLEVVLLYERHEHLLALFYALSSVIICVGVVFLMLWLLRPAPV